MTRRSDSLDGHRVDHDVLDWTIARTRLHLADAAHHIEPFSHFPAHRVPVVAVGRRADRDEELAAVGVGPGIGHRENAGFLVPQRGMELVGELVPWPADALPERVPAL